MTSPSAVIDPAPTKPAQSFETLLSEFLATTIIAQDWRFFVNDKPMSAEVLSDNKMMLPAFLWQAEKTHQLLCGKPLGVKFRSDPDAAVGAVAVVEQVPGRSRSAFPLFLLEVMTSSLEQFTLDGPDTVVAPADVKENTLMGKRVPPRSTACSIDHLVQAFFQDHDLGLVPWTPDSNPRSPNIGNSFP